MSGYYVKLHFGRLWFIIRIIGRSLPLSTPGGRADWRPIADDDNALKASSLQTHLANQHEVYQAVTVPEDYLTSRPAVTYQANPKYNGRLPCPVPDCPGEHKDGWMLRRHFRDLHPFDKVIVPKEGYYLRCERCLMQVNPSYPRHNCTKECQVD